MDISFFVIRPIHNGEEETCRRIVYSGIASEVNIAMRQMFRRKEYYLWCTAVAAVLVLYIGGGGLNPMFIIYMTFPCVAFIAYMALLSFYIREARMVDSDLACLQEHYMTSMNSHFWVCELYEIKNSDCNVRDCGGGVKPRFVTPRELSFLAPDVLDTMTTTIVGTIGVAPDGIGSTPADGNAVVRNGKPSIACVRRLSVKADFRGRGIASQLADTAVRFCVDRNYSVIELDTSEFNEASQRLFNSKGFKLTYTWYKRVIPFLPISTMAFYKYQYSVAHK